MAVTAFGAQTVPEKVYWSRDVWTEAKLNMTFTKFLGTGANVIITHITGLTKTEKGDQAIFHLITPLMRDGVVGDNQREGNEEEMQSHAQTVKIDLLSHQVTNKGKMDDQRSILEFRNRAKSQLAEWLSDRLDQLCMLVLSGIDLSYELTGRKRDDPAFTQLAFAEDVTPPSEKRHRCWSGGKLVDGDNSVLTATDTPTYKAIVDLMSYAKTHRIKPLKEGGKSYYVIMTNAKTLAELKKDPDFLRARAEGGERGKNNPIFTGAIVTIDGAVIHETEHVFNTLQAPNGEKWGVDGKVDGTRTLLCGSQALAFASVGNGDWVEEWFDYKTRQGISCDRMFGFLKPVFHSSYDRSAEDFGVIAFDHAILGDM